jgi:hypothetical protein
VLLVSRFDPDTARSAEWLATLWQGPPPRGVTLHRWLYLGTEPQSMLVLWEAEDDASQAALEAAFNEGGVLRTVSAIDATAGMAAALERDLDGFGQWMRSVGRPEEEVARGVDLRRRGLEAESLEEARAAGRAWAQSQA